MKKIKVLFIYPTQPGGLKVGGVETFQKGFIKFAPKEFEIGFLGIRSASNSNLLLRKINQITVEGRAINFLPLFHEADENKKTFIPLSLRFATSLFLCKRDIFCDYDVFIFNRIEPAISLPFGKYKKLSVIHSDTNATLYNKKSEVLWNRIPFIYNKIEKFLFADFEHIYVVNRKTLMHYKTRYKNRNKFSFLPTWVDKEQFNFKKLSKQSARDQIKKDFPQVNKFKEWVLFVGRLQAVKAPHRLIDVFSYFQSVHPDSCLIIIGDGNLKASVERQVLKKGISKNVFFLGMLPQDIVAIFYRGADVLLLTSNYEGMPRCVLESLGCGTPVVSTKVGEVELVVKNGKSGEVVANFDAQHIFRALNKVIENKHLYDEENCQKSTDRYTPKKVLAPVYEYIAKIG